MPVEFPKNLQSIKKNLEIIQKECEELHALHHTQVSAFLEKFGKPEGIAATFLQDEKIKRLTIQAKEYYASVKTSFDNFANMIHQLESGMASLNNVGIERLLSMYNIQEEHYTYRSLVERNIRLQAELDLATADTPVSRTSLIKAEKKNVEQRLETYTAEEKFLFNYFELIHDFNATAKRLSTYSVDLELLIMLLSSPEYQVKVSSLVSKSYISNVTYDDTYTDKENALTSKLQNLQLRKEVVEEDFENMFNDTDEEDVVDNASPKLSSQITHSFNQTKTKANAKSANAENAPDNSAFPTVTFYPPL